MSSRLATWLAVFAAGGAAFLGVGFLFHTDFDGVVLGKWRLGYGAFLLAWWLILTPGVFLLVRWLLRTQSMTLPSGRTLYWRPSAKILLVILLGWLFAHGVDVQVRRALGRGVATPLQSDVFHPYLQNMPTPGKRRFSVNRHGFRGAPIERAKPEGTYRIFVLGGSTVFCAALPLEQTHPERLRLLLQAEHPERTIEVQNAGAEWHCSLHSLIKYPTWIRQFEPDLLVVYHGINDLYRSWSPEAFAVGPYREDYGHFHGAVSNLVRPEATTWQLVRMRLGYWLSDLRYDRVRVTGPEGEGVKGIRQMFFPRSREVDLDAWASEAAFTRNMKDLIQTARQDGVDVLVASQPSLYRADLTAAEKEVVWFPHAHQQDGERASIASMAAGMRRFNRISREVAEALSVGFVDLDAALPKDAVHLYDDVHVTAAGAGLIAEALAAGIENAGLIGTR